MPELPEVENLRRGLEQSILGSRIIKVKVGKPKLVSGRGNIRPASRRKAGEFIKGLTGEKFLAVERRAKNLIFKLSHDKIILVHLKMTGQFVYVPSPRAPRRGRKNISTVMGGHPIEISEKILPHKHTHVVLELDRGTLYYNDPRMFGYLLYYPSLKAFEEKNHFANLGKEPLDKSFTLQYLTESLKNKKSKIKSVLMGQDVVVGIGNIYTDECLFESGIDPRRSAASLSLKEAEKLHKAILRIVQKAIKLGGSSVATYRLLDESRGNYAREHKVYGKEGEKCPNCGSRLKRILIQSRATIFCPKCQT